MLLKADTMYIELLCCVARLFSPSEEEVALRCFAAVFVLCCFARLFSASEEEVEQSPLGDWQPPSHHSLKVHNVHCVYIKR